MPNPELDKADVLILLDIIKTGLEKLEAQNKDIINSGWSGTGAVGFAIVRYKEIIAKLETLLGKLKVGA